MKNKKLIIILSILGFLILATIIFFIVAFSPVSKKDKEVTFVIKEGTNKIQIVDNLKKAGLIKSKYATLAYVFFSPNSNLQAGTYIINASDNAIDIIKQIANGDTKEIAPTVQITFVEGKRFVDYANLISNNFNIEYDDIILKIKDETYLRSLIDKYWFLDESILDNRIYYSLEGYLAPNTYEFYQTASIEMILEKLLDQTKNILDEYKSVIEESNYSVHEILTMASIIEKEALIKEDREKVSQVIYKRLNKNMTLGMDVTTYYGVHKVMGVDKLTASDLAEYNAYNTRHRNFTGLPASAICNASSESIESALYPSDTNFEYFIADIKTGKVYFPKDYNEFLYYKNVLGLGE